MQRRKEKGVLLDSSQVFHVSHTVCYLLYTFQKYMNVYIHVPLTLMYITQWL